MYKHGLYNLTKHYSRHCGFVFIWTKGWFIPISVWSLKYTDGVMNARFGLNNVYWSDQQLILEDINYNIYA